MGVSLTDFANFCGPSYVDQNVDSESAINFYLEQVQSGNGRNPSGYVMKRSPGLTTIYDLGVTAKARGAYRLANHIYFVFGNVINHFTWDGTNLNPVDNAVLNDDGLPVYFAANPALTQLVTYSDRVAWLSQLGTTTPITWMGVDVLGVELLNQFFLFLAAAGDGFFFSEPGDAGTGDPLNFVSAEASPNRFIRMLKDHEQIWLFGDGPITQVFYNDVSDPNEPFKSVGPSGVIPRGTVAAASPIVINNRVYWIGDDGTAYRSNGYLPEPVSTYAIQKIWADYTTMSDAWSYWVNFNGHDMWRIWFPTADETWEYDTEMPIGLGWRRISSWEEVPGQHIAWRGSATVLISGAVTLVGDRENGLIYRLDPNVFSDAGTTSVCERVAPVINSENKLIEFPWFELDMLTGVGDGSNLDPDIGPITPEANPIIFISYSNDWGRSFSNEAERSMGRQGEFTKRVIVTPCGTAFARCFRVRVSAAVPVVINNAYLANIAPGFG